MASLLPSIPRRSPVVAGLQVPLVAGLGCPPRGSNREPGRHSGLGNMSTESAKLRGLTDLQNLDPVGARSLRAQCAATRFNRGLTWGARS